MLATEAIIFLHAAQDSADNEFCDAWYLRFDGDGMVHACRIKDGKIAYSNRLVQTHRLQRELNLGFPVYQRVRRSNLE